MTPISSDILLQQLQWRYAVKKFDATRTIPSDDWDNLSQVLVLTPSSYGLQPWRFFVITDRELRAKLLPFTWNQKQVVDASHVVVFAVRTEFGEPEIDRYLARVAEVRGVAIESLAGFRKMLVGSLVSPPPGFDLRVWASNQVYIALGQFMATAAMMGIDTCPMEGFQPEKYDEILRLPERGFTSVVLAAVGYRAPDDRNASLAKVRFPQKEIVVPLSE